MNDLLTFSVPHYELCRAGGRNKSKIWIATIVIRRDVVAAQPSAQPFHYCLFCMERNTKRASNKMKRKATCPQKSPVSKAVAPSSFLYAVALPTTSNKRSFLPRNLLKRKQPIKQKRRLSIHSNQIMQSDGRMAVRTQKVKAPFGCVFCSAGGFSGTGTYEHLWAHCLRAHPEYDSHLVQTKHKKVSTNVYIYCCIMYWQFEVLYIVEGNIIDRSRPLFFFSLISSP